MQICSQIFNFGLPKRVITDNGPCFKVVDFAEFHENLGVKLKRVVHIINSQLVWWKGWFRQSNR